MKEMKCEKIFKFNSVSWSLLLCATLLPCATLCYIMLHYANATLYYIMLHYATLLPYATLLLCPTLLPYAKLCYIMLHYCLTLHYATLCYITSIGQYTL
jgi:hypothetical protein